MMQDVLYGPGDVILDRYELVRLLGSGGWGRVYLANDRMLHRLVAIKQLLPRLAADPAAVSRFKREASVVASIRDPFVLTIHDIAERDGQHYMVMEYADAGTLAQMMQIEGILPAYEAISVAIDVCKGLRAVHSKGIVHRDLKPANVMFFSRTDGLPDAKLGDFGIALQPEDVRLTPSDNVMGTLIYLSPEQASNSRVVTRSSDLYSLGVMLYEMMGGELQEPAFANPVFNGSDSGELSQQLGMIPDPARPIIIKALRRKPEDRFQSADEMLQALERSRSRLTSSFSTQAIAQEALPIPATPAPETKRSTRLLAILGIALAIVAGGAMVALGVRVGSANPTRGAVSASSPGAVTSVPVVTTTFTQPPIPSPTPLLSPSSVPSSTPTPSPSPFPSPTPSPSPSPSMSPTPSPVPSPSPLPSPSAAVAVATTSQVTGTATLKALFRDSASAPEGVYEMSEKTASAPVVYLEGSYLWGEIATGIDGAVFQVNRDAPDPDDPSQSLPSDLRLNIEYSPVLLSVMQDVVNDPPGFDAKTGEFWVGRFQCGSARPDESPVYWISVQLLEDDREIIGGRYKVSVLSNLDCAEGGEQGGGPPSRRE